MMSHGMLPMCFMISIRKGRQSKISPSLSFGMYLEKWSPTLRRLELTFTYRVPLVLWWLWKIKNCIVPVLVTQLLLLSSRTNPMNLFHLSTSLPIKRKPREYNSLEGPLKKHLGNSIFPVVH